MELFLTMVYVTVLILSFVALIYLAVGDWCRKRYFYFAINVLFALFVMELMRRVIL